jgi:hypothetical protein
VLSAELPFDGDVQLPSQGATQVLSLDLPAGQAIVTATVAVTNRGDNDHQVDVWFTATNPAGMNIAGPRSAQIGLAPGLDASVTLGPVVASLPNPTTLLLIAQRDATVPSDGVWVTEGTALMNRAGATGMVALLSTPQ